MGHAITNETDRQMDFNVSLAFRYAFEAEADANSRLPDASVGLRLYAREKRGRLLRDVALVSYTTENGATRRASSEDLDFTLTLGPGDTVEVYLAGQARVEVPAERSAACKLSLSELTAEIEARPAPAVRAASDERQ
jgi:hypothetical protein